MISNMLNQRAREDEGVIQTPDQHAHVMVHEALFYRLITDFHRLKRTIFSAFLSGSVNADLGIAMVQRLLAYSYLDPAVGKGIFLKTLLSEIYRLAERYAVYVPEGWVRSHVSGCDIDQQMIRICENKLPGNPRLTQEDYLIRTIPMTADIIIANPPYIRQELIVKEYKQLIRRLAQTNWPELSISARSDLYLYFFLQAASDLSNNGVLTFIIPNSWMDNDYGNALRELLKRHLQINSLLESNRRHFKVEINTIILTVTKKKPERKSSIRLSSDSQIRNMSQAGVNSLQLGWYGSLFRCPEWLLQEIHSNKNLSPLERHFTVSTGIITGNNLKYYRSQSPNGSYSEAIRSPREVSAIEFGTNNVRSWIQTKNVSYTIRRAPLLWTDLRGGRHVVVWNRDGLPFEHTFYGLTPKQSDNVRNWALILNSSWIWLMVEIFGRKGLGGGAIRLVKKDLLKLPIPNLFRIHFNNKVSGFLNRPLENWHAELEKPDRRHVDEIIFKALGLWDRYSECLELIKSMMELRQKKANRQS